MAGAAMLAFLIVMFLAPPFIRFLVRKKVGDRPEFDHANLNELTRHKSNTPTMGGLLIAMALMASTLLFADLSSYYVRMSLFAMIWLAMLGGVDDYFKLRKYTGAKSRDGLKSWEKLLFQIALGVLLAMFIYSHGRESSYIDYRGATINAAHHLYMPFRAEPIALSALAFTVVTVITTVGASNAVNLTDGMDGLAGGCMLIVAAVFLVLAWVAGLSEQANFLHLPYVPEAGELSILCAAIIGVRMASMITCPTRGSPLGA
jgi:phospho-N-acetylmuramoyl-pentapeptide-transferase